MPGSRNAAGVGHISIGTLEDAGVPLHPPRGQVYGVLTRMSVRRLTVAGWTVAARTSVGGLGALLGRPAGGTSDTRFEMARLAAEQGEGWRGWAAVAADLGYADQAHLTRDFQRHLGTTSAAYVARLRPG